MPAVTDVPARGALIVDSEGRATEIMFMWMSLIDQLLTEGFTGTITTAQLTPGGTQGSMTFQSGVLTDHTPAT